MPRCAERRVAGKKLCLKHWLLWRRSEGYRTARAAWRLFLGAAASNHMPVRASSQP